MNDRNMRRIVEEILTRIAPEIEEDGLVSDLPLRTQVDLDSMDWLNFLIALKNELHVEIPERDYGQLVTVDDLVHYLTVRVSDRSDP